jgi:hypothetical protein
MGKPWEAYQSRQPSASPGLFDDLIPQKAATGGGLFDDLIPQKPKLKRLAWSGAWHVLSRKVFRLSAQRSVMLARL